MAQFEEILKDELDGYAPESRKPELSVEALRVPLSAIDAGCAKTLHAGALVQEAVQIIEQPGISCVMITDEDDRLVGLITERDLCTRVISKGIDPKTARVEEIMTENPITLRTDQPMTHALAQMDVGGYRHVPLVDRDSRPAGVITARRIINYIAEFFPEEVAVLPPRETAPDERHGG
jgi:signal-transduction protein with cAMP-binding, CBS, and nucleotidyltransferase domain